MIFCNPVVSLVDLTMSFPCWTVLSVGCCSCSFSALVTKHDLLAMLRAIDIFPPSSCCTCSCCSSFPSVLLSVYDKARCVGYVCHLSALRVQQLPGFGSHPLVASLCTCTWVQFLPRWLASELLLQAELSPLRRVGLQMCSYHFPFAFRFRVFDLQASGLQTRAFNALNHAPDPSFAISY